MSPSPCLMHEGAHVNSLCCEPALHSFILILSSQWIFTSLPSTTYPRDPPKRGCFSLWGFSHQVIKFLRQVFTNSWSNNCVFCTCLAYFSCLEYILGDCKNHSDWMAVCSSFEHWCLSTAGVALSAMPTGEIQLLWGPFFGSLARKNIKQLQYKLNTSLGLPLPLLA